MSPEEYNHPCLAYIQPRTAVECPTLVAVLGRQTVSIPLTTKMLVQLAEQAVIEIRKVHAAEPPRNDY